MSRITNTASGHGHSCRQIDNHTFAISWCYDYFPKGVNWRATKKVKRTTDETGAKKFCSKWNIKPKTLSRIILSA